MTFAEIMAALETAAADPETPKMIADISTGEGGLAKIMSVGTDLAILSGHVMAAASAHPAVATS